MSQPARNPLVPNLTQNDHARIIKAAESGGLILCVGWFSARVEFAELASGGRFSVVEWDPYKYPAPSLALEGSIESAFLVFGGVPDSLCRLNESWEFHSADSRRSQGRDLRKPALVIACEVSFIRGPTYTIFDQDLKPVSIQV